MRKFFSVVEALSFEDVLLVPQQSYLTSRQDVDLSTKVGPLELKLPVISSPMSTITELEMAKAMGEGGGAGFLHRYMEAQNMLLCIKDLKAAGHPAVPCVGLYGDSKKLYLDMIYAFLDAGADAISIDVAHADCGLVYETVKALKDAFNCPLVVGAICTAGAARRLCELGVDVLKVGVGAGSRCTTREVTGHGVPQLYAIDDISATVNGGGTHNCSIIADGGIRNTGDILKALAAGAYAVMLGYMFAGTQETPGAEVAFGGEAHYKLYAGMASEEVRNAHYQNASCTVPEGEAHYVVSKGPVNEVLSEIRKALKSGFAYSGAANLQQFHVRSRFIKLTPSTLGENGVTI